MAWNAGLDGLGLESAPEPIGVVATVAEQLLRLEQVVQQSGRTGIVADLSNDHEEARGTTVRIGYGIELGVHAANQASKILLFTRRLQAARCAFR